MSGVFVTGAGGFIGSHLVERLLETGREVTAFVRYSSTSNLGWLDELSGSSGLRVRFGDVRDYHSVLGAMQGCSSVLHLAALIGIPYSYEAPDSYIATNVSGTLNVLQAARALGVSKIVTTSTSEVYGTALQVPIDESHPLQSQSPYSASKAGADHLAVSFARSFDMPITVVRPFNTYGPRQSLRAVIPTIIAQALTGRSEIMLGSVHPTRDLTYVSDTVGGFLAAAGSERGVGDVVNLGTGHEISVGELATTIGRLMGVELRGVEDSERLRPAESEVERLVAEAPLSEGLHIETLGLQSLCRLR